MFEKHDKNDNLERRIQLKTKTKEQIEETILRSKDELEDYANQRKYEQSQGNMLISKWVANNLHGEEFIGEVMRFTNQENLSKASLWIQMPNTFIGNLMVPIRNIRNMTNTMKWSLNKLNGRFVKVKMGATYFQTKNHGATGD